MTCCACARCTVCHTEKLGFCAAHYTQLKRFIDSLCVLWPVWLFRCVCLCGRVRSTERLLRAVSCVSCCVCNVWHFSPRLGVPSACVVCAFCLDLSLPPASSSHTTFCLAWCVPSACACRLLPSPPPATCHQLAHCAGSSENGIVLRAHYTLELDSWWVVCR